MKTNDIKALHTKSSTELQKDLEQMLLDLANMRLKAKAGKLENSSQLKSLRKDIARVKTIMTLKKLNK